jgi:aryl-alcohol dehydrogenase-like predicted oxidoreductase
MRYVEADGARLSAIGLGTWQFGSREWGYGRDYAERDAGAIVRRAVELGVNLIDTAEIYGFGASERILGRALVGHRERAFVATKVFPLLPLAPVVEQRGRMSAKRLGIERIDLYQVHWPNPVVPLGTTVDGLRRLQQHGIVDRVGVSNFDLARWQEAERLLGGPVLSNQVRYSLVARGPEAELLPYAAERDRLVIAYSPLAQGFLSARYTAANAPGGVRATNALFLPENLARGAELLESLREIAKAHDATPAQVALAWVIRRPKVVAIPGASSVAQLEANVAAADLDLTPDEDARLTDASDRFHPVGGMAVAPDLLRARLRR